MRLPTSMRPWLLLLALVALLHALTACPPGAAAPAVARAPLVTRDGAHDFDFEIGSWRTHVRRLQDPLSGSTAWVEYDGTTVVRPVWDGRANLVELTVDGPAGHIEGLSLRLYDPSSHRWSLHFASSRSGEMSPPTIGGFDQENRRGEFLGQETIGGKPVLVRFVISAITPTSCHFEQSFSQDGGRSWEVNWIATDTRVTPATGDPQAPLTKHD